MPIRVPPWFCRQIPSLWAPTWCASAHKGWGYIPSCGGAETTFPVRVGEEEASQTPDPRHTLPPGCQLHICSHPAVPHPQHPWGFGVSVVGREVGGEPSPASRGPLATETPQTEPSKFLPPRRVRSQLTGPRHSPVLCSAPGARLCCSRGLSLTSAGRTPKARLPGSRSTAEPSGRV